MTTKTITMLCLVGAFAVGTSSGAMRPTPEYLKSAVVYQIVLRNFTRDGDFKAATAMLDHVRGAGIDVVYLTPFVEMDRDMDRNGWSPRQIKTENFPGYFASLVASKLAVEFCVPLIGDMNIFKMMNILYESEYQSAKFIDSTILNQSNIDNFSLINSRF